MSDYFYGVTGCWKEAPQPAKIADPKKKHWSVYRWTNRAKKEAKAIETNLTRDQAINLVDKLARNDRLKARETGRIG